MCGIFGLIAKADSKLKNADIQGMSHSLFLLSQSRGSEAAGIAIYSDDKIQYFKRAMSAKRMLKMEEYRSYLQEALYKRSRGGVAVIGHSRLVTNGTQGVDENNQPIVSTHCIGVHNGIVVNDNDLWATNSDIRKLYQVDTEVIYRLIDKNFEKYGNIAHSVKATFGQLKGEANIAFFHDALPLLCIATNVGSLYFIELKLEKAFVFASERYFIDKLMKKFKFVAGKSNGIIKQLSPGKGITINIDNLIVVPFDLREDKSNYPQLDTDICGKVKLIINKSPKRTALVRCACCILPHTFPFITFDSEGVCNYCREDVPARVDNRVILENQIAHYRRDNGQPDCIVALSGGRDSCYGLHYIKRELGLNPIAYTYDWAMVTDEARRNCSRVCGELKVEHIIRSADIQVKRRNIRLNIEAWLKRPELGMIPLFMAGDKQFFYYATQVSKQTNIPLVFFCGGNNLEVTRFKTGFCGVQDRSVNTMVGLDWTGKCKLLAYYMKNYIFNPAYLNRSLLDTLFAFYSTYIARSEFYYLYRYVDWDEKTIADTLKTEYDWESAEDSASTWRIGDGTAAFYNYIYYTVASFTEHDTFRSNQIRAGLITREEALRQIEYDNMPRLEAMREYAQLVGFNLDSALSVINNIPKIG